MQGLRFRIRGRWAHFRRPETNNTPLTHDFITKTAMIGLIGAVLGVERPDMCVLFPTLCTDLLYGVHVAGAVKKQSWAFTLRNPHRQSEQSPRHMEFLRDPDYTVALCLHGDRSRDTLRRFSEAVRASESCYTPVLGLHNCPAEIEWLGEEEFTPGSGPYTSSGFVLRTHRPSEEFNFRDFRLGFDRIPTYQDSDWWNLPDMYREVMYPSAGSAITVIGDHYRSRGGETWCLI